MEPAHVQLEEHLAAEEAGSPRPAGRSESQPRSIAPGEVERTAFVADDFDLVYPPGIEAHYWTLARNLIIEAELRRLGLEGSRILELGCGKGIVIDHLVRRGLDCRGVELANVEPLPAVRDRVLSGVDRVPAELAAWGETLLLLDVLEHLEDPARFVREVLDVHGGIRRVLITVPARRELWSNYDERYGHRRRYDRRSLRKTIEAAGLEATKTRYLFRLLYMPARVLVLLGGKRSVAIRAPGPGMRPVHAALARCLLLESRMLPRWVAGTSLLCAARVPGR